LFTWDVLGRRDRVQYANGTDVTFGYDRDGHLRLLCSKHPGGDTGIHDYLEQRLHVEEMDPDGHPVHFERRQGMTQGSSCATSAGNQPELYTNSVYDGRHQLVSRGGIQNESYQYDGSGNMTVRTIGSDQATFVMGSNTNRLASGTIDGDDWQFTHDASGSRVKDSMPVAVGPYWRKYFHNALGQLLGDSAYGDFGEGPLPYGNLQPFRYDARGRRVKAQSGPSAYLIYDGDNVVRIGGSAGEWRIIQGPGVDDPLVGAHLVSGTWTKYYYLTDGRGRQLAFTDVSGGNQQDAEVYTGGGGQQAGGITHSYGFYNSRSGTSDAPQLSFYRHRYYDQMTGRWTQEDPIGVAGGINLYQYAGNNPATFTDPFGLCVPPIALPCPVVGASAMGGPLGIAVVVTLSVSVGVALLPATDGAPPGSIVQPADALPRRPEVAGQARQTLGKTIKGIITGILIGVGAAGPLVPEVDKSDPTQTGAAGRSEPAAAPDKATPPPAGPDTLPKTVPKEK